MYVSASVANLIKPKQTPTVKLKNCALFLFCPNLNSSLYNTISAMVAEIAFNKLREEIASVFE